MPTPLKPLPGVVDRWVRRAVWLRRLDALAAWLALWVAAALVLPDADGIVHAALAALVGAAAALVPGLRARWRPVTGAVALAVSRDLRPGDRAWRIGPDEAELVLVTARRGLGAVIARPARGPEEGVPVRRTQVLLVPAD